MCGTLYKLTYNILQITFVVNTEENCNSLYNRLAALQY